MRSRRLLGAACGVFACSFPCLAGAQSTDPEKDALSQSLFDRGVEHLEAGRHAQACPLIEQSYKVDPRPGTLFALAECEAKRGRTATAVARYEEYLAMYEALSPDKKAKQGDRQQIALAQVNALKPRLPHLKLVLRPGSPKQTVVKRDGVLVDGSALGNPLAVDPGEHRITTQAPGGPVETIAVQVEEAETKQVTLFVTERAPIPSREVQAGAAPKPDTRSSGSRAGTYVLLSIGVTAFTLSQITGALALTGEESITDRFTETMTLVSLSSLGVGLGGTGMATVLYFSEASDPAAASSGHFLSGAAVAAGPHGISLAYRGAW